MFLHYYPYPTLSSDFMYDLKHIYSERLTEKPLNHFHLVYKTTSLNYDHHDLYKFLKELYEKNDESVEKIKQPKEKIYLAKLEKRDVYVFVKIKSNDVCAIRKTLLQETQKVASDNFVTIVDDLTVIYNKVYNDMEWDKDNYEIVYPYGK